MEVFLRLLVQVLELSLQPLSADSSLPILQARCRGGKWPRIPRQLLLAVLWTVLPDMLLQATQGP